jgi:GAF domain-containing protein
VLQELPRSISFCGHAILQDEIFVIPDTLNDERFSDNPVVVGATFIRFYARQPLRAINGQRMGTLCVLDQSPRDFDEHDSKNLQDLALMVEKELNFPDFQRLTNNLRHSESKLLEAVQTLKLEEESERLRNRTLEMIARGAALDVVLKSIIRNVQQQNIDMRCYILKYDEKLDLLTLGAAPDLPKIYTNLLHRVPIAEGCGSCVTAAFRKERVITPDVLNHPNWQTYREEAQQAGIASCWSEPIID